LGGPNRGFRCQTFLFDFFYCFAIVKPMGTKNQEEKDLTSAQAARLFEVVALAVAELGGASRSVDTEDVAIRCHELAPTLFSWRKYPSQVNLEIVRVSLSDAKKQKNGQLLSGSGRDGWRLTRRGLDWISRVAPSRHVSERVGLTRRTAGSIDTVRAAREVARLEASEAWAHWKAGRAIDLESARALFRIDSYTSEQLVDIKVTRLLSAFEAEAEHRKFLEAASAALNTTGAKA
jgi:hypothetical protein